MDGWRLDGSLSKHLGRSERAEKERRREEEERSRSLSIYKQPSKRHRAKSPNTLREIQHKREERKSVLIPLGLKTPQSSSLVPEEHKPEKKSEDARLTSSSARTDHQHAKIKPAGFGHLGGLTPPRGRGLTRSSTLLAEADLTANVQAALSLHPPPPQIRSRLRLGVFFQSGT